MVAVISVDAYPFLAFSDLTCNLDDTGIGVFWQLLIVRRLDLEVATKRFASLSAGKNAGVVLVPCHTWKYVHTPISGGVDISMVHRCHLLRHMSSQCGPQNYFKDWCLMNSQPNFLFLTYFYLDELWPYHQKDVNQINFNHTTL